METKTKNFKFFQHRGCEYFPCHAIERADDFNCLFCYCPLYALGEECGGHFSYTDKGVKNCINCTIPHQRANYDDILKKLEKLMEKLKIKK